jgi:hypothetical protein
MPTITLPWKALQSRQLGQRFWMTNGEKETDESRQRFWRERCGYVTRRK